MNFWRGLAKFFGVGTGPSILKDGLSTIDSLVTTAEERAALRTQIVTKWVDAQSVVIAAEAQSGNALTSSWRPLVMLSFAGILVYSFFVGPMFGLRTVDIPPDLWTLLQVGIGGYIGGRSLEKIVPQVIPYGKKELKGVTGNPTNS